MKSVFGFLFTFLCVIVCHAQVLTLPASEAVSPGMWLCYRMNVPLNDEPLEVELRIAADSKYWLWVNGELQVREGGLKRDPNPKDTYCDVLQGRHGLLRVTIWWLYWYGTSARMASAIAIRRRQDWLSACR